MTGQVPNDTDALRHIGFRLSAQSGHLLSLLRTNLHRKESARLKIFRCLSDQPPVKVKTVIAAAESQLRLCQYPGNSVFQLGLDLGEANPLFGSIDSP